MEAPCIKYKTRKFGQISRFKLTTKKFIYTWVLIIICYPDTLISILRLTVDICDTEELRADKNECLYLLFRISQFYLKIQDDEFAKRKLKKEFLIGVKYSYMPHISHELYVHVLHWVEKLENINGLVFCDIKFKNGLDTLYQRLNSLKFSYNLTDTINLSNDDSQVVNSSLKIVETQEDGFAEEIEASRAYNINQGTRVDFIGDFADEHIEIFNAKETQL